MHDKITAEKLTDYIQTSDSFQGQEKFHKLAENFMKDYRALKESYPDIASRIKLIEDMLFIDVWPLC